MKTELSCSNELQRVNITFNAKNIEINVRYTHVQTSRNMLLFYPTAVIKLKQSKLPVRDAATRRDI